MFKRLKIRGSFMSTRRVHLEMLLSVLGLASLSARSAAAEDTPFAGTWTGYLQAGTTRLRLRLILGKGTAELISLDQGDARIPGKTPVTGPDHIDVRFPAIGARFRGKLDGRDKIEGVFTQGADIPLTFYRGEEAPVAQIPSAEPLSAALLSEKRRDSLTPALAAGWARGPSTDIQADGLRSAKADTPVTPDDVWHWGSITKSMTATLTARLVEAGHLTWDTPLASVLKAAADTPYATATMRHLLCHRAGFTPNLNPLVLMGYSRDPDTDPRPQRLKYLCAALDQTPAGAPGTQMVYSNSGYVAAGAMLEHLTGQTWEDLMRQHLFVPLGLRSAGFGAPGHKGLIDQPLGHIVSGQTRKPVAAGKEATNDNPVVIGPAGRVHMSLADMLAYLSAHRDRREAFLKRETWDVLHTPPFGDDYAFGWIVRPDGSLWHNGSNTLWYAEAMVDRAAGAVCAAAGNDASPATQLTTGTLLASARRAAGD